MARQKLDPSELYVRQTMERDGHRLWIGARQFRIGARRLHFRDAAWALFVNTPMPKRHKPFPVCGESLCVLSEHLAARLPVPGRSPQRKQKAYWPQTGDAVTPNAGTCTPFPKRGTYSIRSGAK